MPDDLDERLSRLRRRLTEREHLLVRRDHLNAEIEKMHRRVATHRAALRFEEQAVEKLEGMSFASFARTLIGDRKERLREEEERLAEAKLRLDGSLARLEGLAADHHAVEERLASLQTAEDELARALDEKASRLADDGGPVAARLLELSEECGRLEAELHELDEAITAGDKAGEELEASLAEIEKAVNWGTWDMLGGGLLVTWAKHQRLDAAKSCLERAQSALERFNHELSDVSESFRFSTGLGDFLGFADYFLDGLIVDWVVQSKTLEARRHLEALIGDLHRLVGELDARKGDVSARLSATREKRIRRIEATD